MTVFKTIRAASLFVLAACQRQIRRTGKIDRRQAKWLFLLVTALLLVNQAFAADEPELQVRAEKPGAIVTVERVISDGKILLSVTDAAHNPVLGLTKEDFTVTTGARTARIIEAQPIEESLDVPRHIVLILDNSDSMRQRQAIGPLLAGVDELLKIMRPIDTMQIVVFTSKETINMGGRDLHVQTFASSNPIELKNFAAGIYRDGITSTTVLYEGMLAGLDLIQTLPKNEPRFMVVFSDGEDLNSAYKKGEVIKATEGVARFDAYAIDYMPGAAIDPFLTAFAEQNNGQIWKATSEANLVPIFQKVASKMQYYYVLSYLFPSTGSLTVAPASLNIDELEALNGAVLPEGSAPIAPEKNKGVIRSIDATSLTLRPVVDTVYGIAHWKTILANTGGTFLVENAGEGTPPAEIVIPLTTEDQGLLAAGGDIKVSMEVQDGREQSIVLTAPDVKVNLFRTTANLTATPLEITIEEIKTIDSSPMLGHIYFRTGSSDLSAQYVRLAGPEQTQAFDEQSFRDTLEKYYQVLNIIGKRLLNHPAATITLTGCNDNTGPEKGSRALSTARAEAVRDYLQTVWKIAPERLKINARNLPEIPSTSKLEEGRAENRRVEISADDSAILAPVRSTYLSTRIDAEALTLSPEVKAAHGVAQWTVRAVNSSGNTYEELSGEGAVPAEITIPLKTEKLNELATGGDITLSVTVKDQQGQELVVSASQPVKVNFIQTSQRLAQKLDFKVQEKYALILFAFDSDAISARNQEIVNSIVARIKELPQATAEIVGHTDNIGKEEYNIKLSQRRALSVFKLLSAAYGEGGASGQISQNGVGPQDPLFDNMTPQARAFNRTVTITLEYMADN